MISYFTPKILIISIMLLGIIQCCYSLLYTKHSNTKIVVSVFISLLFLINTWMVTLSFINGINAKITIFHSGIYYVSFSLEAIGLVFLNMLAVLWPAAIIYTSKFISFNKIPNKSQFLFFTNLCLFLGALISLSANLFTVFVLYELLTLMTIPLIGHIHVHGTIEGLLKYLKILFSSSLLLFLPAILVIYHVAGHGDFTSQGFISEHFSKTETIILLLMMIFGIAKAALFPVHGWLPAAMVASYPVSALLHAVVVVKTGLFCIYKILVYIFGIDYLHNIFSEFNWLLFFPAITILYSSVQSVRQRKIKMILAFSTINQLNIALLSAFLLTPKGINAAILHMVSHSFTKIALFYATGSIFSARKIYDIYELVGTYKTMPKTSFMMLIAGLSLIGIPPFGGFVSKFYIMHAAIEADNLFVVLVICLSAVLSTLYMLKILMFIYKPVNKELAKNIIFRHKDSALPTIMIIAPAICTMYIILFPFIQQYITTILSFVSKY